MQLLINQNKWCLWAGSVSSGKRSLATFGFILMLIALWYFFVQVPLDWYKQSLASSLAAYEQNNENGESLKVQIEQAESRYQKLLASISKNNPTGSLRTGYVLKMNKLAQNSGLKVDSCTVQGVPANDQCAFELAAYGNFDELLAFLACLSADDNALRFQELVVEKKDTGLAINGLFHLGDRQTV
jgi:hypothetical protein